MASSKHRSAREKRIERVTQDNVTKYHAVWSALDGVIEAWESLPGGEDHSTEDMAEWLAKKMAPAIQRGRVALGRKRPDEDPA